MAALTLEICTPDRTPRIVEAQEIILPGAGGVFTVLAGHTPTITLLDQGVLIAYTSEDDGHYFAVNGGFAEVLSDKVVVLTHTVEHHNDIDRSRAEAARSRAQSELESGDGDAVQAEAALARAMARLQAHGKEDLR